VSTVLNAAGLWWGLPNIWAGDEVTPLNVLSGLAQHFSHGWFFTYPPFHYYVLTAAFTPVLALDRVVGLPPFVFDMVLLVIGRGVTVVMATVTVFSTYLIGRWAFGSWAAVFAAALMALVAPFLYYSKMANLDVPYLMWFAISLIFYLRILEGGTSWDYAWFALTATLAVCTKDQAYGLYALMPLPIVYERWRANSESGTPRPLVRALFDRRIAVAIGVAVVTFVVVHNIIFNSGGFVAHVQNLIGPQSTGYRAFEPTIAGRWALTRVTARIIQVSLGWPSFVVSAVGVIAALADPRTRRRAIWLLVPAVSYYVFFTNVILYNYDRFVLPLCFVFVLFGGFALELWLFSRSFHTLRVAGAGALLAYSFLYAATVDVLMLNDSRYTVERWLQSHAQPGIPIAVSSFPTYMPRLQRYEAKDVYDPAVLDQMKPAYFIVNADYTLTEPATSGLGRILSSLRDGTRPYKLVMRYRSPCPWPWLPGGHPDLIGPRRDPFIVSFLRNINPLIEVYERVPDQ
jgi:hypothetical protein